MLLGNKSDLKDKRLVTEEEANVFSNNTKMTYYDTSAKEGTNVKDAFHNLAKSLKEKADKEKNIKTTSKT